MDADPATPASTRPSRGRRLLWLVLLAMLGRAQGWTTQPPQTRASSDVQGVELRSGELYGRRGDVTVAVLYESGPALRGGGTHVAVHVSRD